MFSLAFSQSIEIQNHFILNNSKPFWIISNNNGKYENGSIIGLRINDTFKNFKYDLDLVKPYNEFPSRKLFFSNGYLSYNKNNLFFDLGKKNISDRESALTSGSLIESMNAEAIPKVSFGLVDFYEINFFKNSFKIKSHFAHGWLDKSSYLKSPFLHEKSFYIKENFPKELIVKIGLEHRAVWSGETKHHGKQSDGFSDFLKVFFARPGSIKSIEQERNNNLGNHLGIWSLEFEKKINKKVINLKIEHPFEDESGARWFLNEFDGKYSLNFSNLNSKIISNFIYEYIYTMNQSGSEGASDSTYGWDNYFNHYLYMSGWTYKGRMIGNPLFTVGKNPGRYNNGLYVINNRLKAHHFGISGKIGIKVNFRILLTFSQNYGIFPDQNYYQLISKDYKFDDGLEQLSSLYEIKLKNLWKNISITAAYVNDRGELLPKTDSFMMVINYKLQY